VAMALGKFRDKADSIKEKAGMLSEAAVDRVNDLLRELNDAIPTLKSLGLSVKDVDFRMGVIPEVRATLVGSIDALDPEQIQGLIDSNPDKDLLTAVLRSLQSAYHLKTLLVSVGFQRVEMDLKLGLPPSVSVRFVNSQSAA